MAAPHWVNVRNEERNYPIHPEPYPFPNKLDSRVSIATLLKQAAYATWWNQHVKQPEALTFTASGWSTSALDDTCASKVTYVESPPQPPSLLLHQTLAVDPTLVWGKASWAKPADSWDEVAVTNMISHIFDPIFRGLLRTAEMTGSSAVENHGPDKTRPDLTFKVGIQPDAILVTEFKAFDTSQWPGWQELDRGHLESVGAGGMGGVVRQVWAECSSVQIKSC